MSSYIGSTGIFWVDKNGRRLPARGSVPGTAPADIGKNPDQYSPFGMAVAPDGTLYFVDIHVACKGLLTGCGPASYGGRVMKVTFANGRPSAPVAVAGGFDFPTSVTVCVPAAERCPYPSGKIVAPLTGPSENPASTTVAAACGPPAPSCLTWGWSSLGRPTASSVVRRCTRIR